MILVTDFGMFNLNNVSKIDIYSRNEPPRLDISVIVDIDGLSRTVGWYEVQSDADHVMKRLREHIIDYMLKQPPEYIGLRHLVRKLELEMMQ